MAVLECGPRILPATRKSAEYPGRVDRRGEDQRGKRRAARKTRSSRASGPRWKDRRIRQRVLKTPRRRFATEARSQGQFLGCCRNTPSRSCRGEAQPPGRQFPIDPARVRKTPFPDRKVPERTGRPDSMEASSQTGPAEDPGRNSDCLAIPNRRPPNALPPGRSRSLWPHPPVSLQPAGTLRYRSRIAITFGLRGPLAAEPSQISLRHSQM